MHASGAMSEFDLNDESAAAGILRRLKRRWRFIAAGAVCSVALGIAGPLPLAGIPAGIAAILVAALVLPMSADRPRLGFSSRPGRGPLESPAAGDVWRAVIDAMPEPALALDAAGVIVHHNGLVGEIFLNARSGQPISYVSRNPELIEAVDDALRAREPRKVLLIERIPVERRISATITILDGSGAKKPLPALLVTFRDLTEQDKLAQMRADFIANASHELRTPLASLRGFVETLQGPARDDPDARDRFLVLMASQAARMTRLIDDLLSLSRVEMRVHLPPRGVVDLNDVAAYVAQTLEPLAEASSVAIEVNRLDAPARIRGDREEIVQVLQNLVHNAIKYGKQGGAVRVSVLRQADRFSPAIRLAVAISDDGPGIEPGHLPRLTERFYRVSVASSREKGGTGLGLAIVKHIMNRHRGELKIESKTGQGSTFTVVFNEVETLR